MHTKITANFRDIEIPNSCANCDNLDYKDKIYKNAMKEVIITYGAKIK